MADTATSSTGGLSECCASGHLRTGKSTGKFEQIGGRRTYVAPSPDGSKSKTIIYITDIFGVDLLNHQLLADTYAKGGFQVLIPEVLDDDPLPHEFLQTIEPKLAVQEKLTTVEKAKNQASTMATFGPWAVKHREAVAKPIIDAFIAEVRKDTAITKLGIVGFCWGGRHSILQAREGTGISAAAALHPSMTANADFEAVTIPLYLGLGDKDSLVPKATVDGIIDVLEKKTTLDKQVRIFPNQIHGFSVRGDYSSDEDRKAMDEAAEEVVEWFKKYLD